MADGVVSLETRIRLRLAETPDLTPGERAMASYELADGAAAMLQLGLPETGYQSLIRAAATTLAWHMGAERAGDWLAALSVQTRHTVFDDDPRPAA